MSTGEVVTIAEYERLKAERARYHKALLSILYKVDFWNNDNRGGLAVQRKRWKILGQMAREALGEG